MVTGMVRTPLLFRLFELLPLAEVPEQVLFLSSSHRPRHRNKAVSEARQSIILMVVLGQENSGKTTSRRFTISGAF